MEKGKSNSKMRIQLAMLWVLAIGFGLRFYKLNWDNDAHLHPDERFLTMVTTDIKLPNSWLLYFDPNSSSLNPKNAGYDFFVYGTLPVTVTKLVAAMTHMDNYRDITQLGRGLSAVMEGLTLLGVVVIATRWRRYYGLNPWLPVAAGWAYALMVLPIQLAHFYTTDIWVNLMALVTIYLGWRYQAEGRLRNWLGMGIVWGMALASKLSAGLLAPLLLVLGIMGALKERRWRKRLGELIWLGVSLGVLTYGSLRLTNPYMFERADWWQPKISLTLMANIKALNGWNNDQVWFPPAVQWIGKPAVIYALVNLVWLGVGVVIAGLVGWGSWQMVKRGKGQGWWGIGLIYGWVVVIFGYQSSQFVKAMRYFIFIYPWLAILAGMGLVSLRVKWVRWLVIAAMMGWPLMFLSIYVKPHSRVVASMWMEENIPNDSTILFEHWDDGLPVVPLKKPVKFKADQLPVFDPDTEAKWQLMRQKLDEADYYILTSNRGWGSIPKVPEKYPLMGQFYRDLMAGKTNYQLIKEFTSYPSLTYLGLPITWSDDWADETFTVYDHPKVMVFNNRDRSK